MRRDVLSFYGGRAATPRLDAFAASHLTFDETVSQAPWTKPAIATLFTSLYPSQHRVESHPRLAGRDPRSAEPVEADVLAPSLETLAEVLQREGVRTAAFVANPWLVAPFGFEQGFDVYDSRFARWGASGEQVVDAGIAWLDGLGEKDRFFLYLHTIDSHRPYGRIPVDDLTGTRARLNAGRPLPTREALRFASRIRLEDGRFAREAGFELTDALLREAYLQGVERFDGIFGRLLDALAARPALDARTAVIVTSDHGEALYERGWGNHGGALYEEDVRVPLFARLPGVRPASARIDCATGLVDWMPTLCGYLDVGCPGGVRGWSLLGGGDRAEAGRARYLVSEGVMERETDRSIRTRRYKLVRQPGRFEGGADFALYDLEADAAERFDRLGQSTRPPEAARAFEVLKPALEAAVVPMPRPDHGTAPLDDEVRRQLEALGYGEAPTSQ
jgi:arylsulfatase A-like enzyme